MLHLFSVGQKVCVVGHMQCLQLYRFVSIFTDFLLEILKNFKKLLICSKNTEIYTDSKVYWLEALHMAQPGAYNYYNVYLEPGQYRSLILKQAFLALLEGLGMRQCLLYIARG